VHVSLFEQQQFILERIDEHLKKVMCSALTTVGVLAMSTVSVMAATTHTVQSGESLWTISRANDVSLPAMEAANPQVVNPGNLQIGSQVKIPSGNYTVQPGDTFFTIANAHGVTWQAIQNDNPGIDPLMILPGQLINVPNGTNSAAATSSSANSAVSDTSLYWMSRLIQAEASGENMEAKVAVGDVVLHRVQSSDYPDTVKGVIFQVVDGCYQFTPVENQEIYNTPSADSITAAEEVLDQGVDYVPGAYVFFTPSKTPSSSWVWNQPRTAQIDDFIFAK
jgi:N-acetylmuramoyl-L-alanine amidase